MRTVDLLELLEEGDDRNSLDGLPQAHIVGQDAIDAALVEADHPVEAHHLIWLELSASHQRWLFRQVGMGIAVVHLLLLEHETFLDRLLLEAAALLVSVFGHPVFGGLVVTEQEVGVVLSLTQEHIHLRVNRLAQQVRLAFQFADELLFLLFLLLHLLEFGVALVLGQGELLHGLLGLQPFVHVQALLDRNSLRFWLPLLCGLFHQLAQLRFIYYPLW